MLQWLGGGLLYAWAVVVAAWLVAPLPLLAQETQAEEEYPYVREEGCGRAVYYFRYTVPVWDAAQQRYLPRSEQLEWRYGEMRGQRCVDWKRDYIEPLIDESKGDEIEPGIGKGCVQAIPPR